MTQAAQERIAHGPVLPVLLALAIPNAFAMLAAAAVNIAETFYVASLGSDALAGIAMVFPFAMLMQTLSVGGIGGAIASALSRAIGENDMVTANLLVSQSILVGLLGGLVFTTVFVAGGPTIYRLLGAEGQVLDQARRYSNVLFSGAPAIWLAASLISVLRGAGSMRQSATAVLLTAGCQIVIGAVAGLGIGAFNGFGIGGVAMGQVVAFFGCACILFAYIYRGNTILQPGRFRLQIHPRLILGIIRQGLPACLSPLQTVLIVLVLTALLTRVGVSALAGYGIGARLEFVVIPMAFGIGIAAIPMIGVALGRGDVLRARRVAWTAGCLSACVAGVIGSVVALFPEAWTGMFNAEPEVIAFASMYLRWAGPGYAFFGLGLALFFASQGAGRVLGPVLAASVRLITIVAGGVWLSNSESPTWMYFALISIAMTIYGLFTAASVRATSWEPRVKLKLNAKV